MKKAIMVFPAITLLMVILISSPSFSQMKMDSKKTATLEISSSLTTNMRQLWVEHVMWTRNVILCLVDELPGTDQAVKRLLQNQIDLGNAMKPYYGEKAGSNLTELLTSHITISIEVVKAAKAGNKELLATVNKSWHLNADEITMFFANANPNWKFEDIKIMMDEHLKLTTNEAMQRINKDYEADVIAFDKVHEEILKMSDMLAEGISKQFPSKIKTASTK